jgi:hypothetical protein
MSNVFIYLSIIILKHVSVSGSYITAPSGFIHPGAANEPYSYNSAIASCEKCTGIIGTT